MLTLATFEALLTPTGQQALAVAASRRPTPTTLLTDLEALREQFGAELASAAIEMAMLRSRAGSKFSRASEMYFTRDALEQATPEPVARHRAMRYAGASTIWDLCCSIGGDSVQLAAQAPVRGIDHDPLRLRMATCNAMVYGVQELVLFQELDVEAWEAPRGDSIFFDPARRLDGRRVFDPDRYQPSLQNVDRWLHRAAGIGVKVAPGIDYDALRWQQHEVEVVSLGGEVKETVLWFGDFVRARRSATVLPAGDTLCAAAIGRVPSGPPGRFLYEPDGAVIRAHLVQELAVMIGAHQIDETIAFLSSDVEVETPFARAFRVHDVLPFNLKRLRQHLRASNIGRVVVKKRGSPIDPQVFERQLRPEGQGSAVLVVTRVQGKPSVLVCDVQE